MSLSRCSCPLYLNRPVPSCWLSRGHNGPHESLVFIEPYDEIIIRWPATGAPSRTREYHDARRYLGFRSSRSLIPGPIA